MACASITSTDCSIPRRTCVDCRAALTQPPRAGHFYLVVEKILAAHETLREDWPIDGTTGYDFLNQLTVAIDRSGRRARLHRLLCEFTGEQRRFGEIARLCKLHIMDNEMSSELNVLARDMARLARAEPAHRGFHPDLLRRAIKELIACFPVYRTYIDSQRRWTMPISAT